MGHPQQVILDESIVLYVFEKAGDELPLHDHTFSHKSVIAVGRIEWFTDDPELKGQVEAWHSITFTAGRKHGLRALTDGAMALNVMNMG